MSPKPRTEDEIKNILFKAIHSIAPEIDLQSIDPGKPLRDQVDLDSIDFLNLIVTVHEKLGVDIPEADYSKLSTLGAILSYLNDKLQPSALPREASSGDF
jgi:acyl carrier protein